MNILTKAVIVILMAVAGAAITLGFLLMATNLISRSIG